MRRAVGMIGLCWLLAARASAQQPAALPLELSWQAPPECGSEADVRAQLERVARALPGYALAPLRADARVDRQERLYALSLITEHEGERGERKLEASDCPTLVRSMTLVLALAFGKGVELAEPANDTAAGSDTAAQTQDTKPAASTSTPEPSATESRIAKAARLRENDEAQRRLQESENPSWLHLSVGLGASAQLALLPAPAFAAALSVELTGYHWTLALRYQRIPGVAESLEPGLDARFDGHVGSLVACAKGQMAYELALCVSTGAASLRGRSRGAFDDSSARAPWVGLGPLVWLRWPATPAQLSVQLEAGLDVSLARPRFVIAGYRDVHRVALFTGQLGGFFVFTF